MKKRILAAMAFLSLAGAASAGFNIGIENSDDQHYYRSSGISSFDIHYGGDIELSPNREKIVSMAPDAYLEIERRIFVTTRRLRATASANGAVEIHFWIGERTGSEAEAREFLARYLPEAVRETAIGARSEARRLLKAGDPVRVIEAARERESERAREAYFDVVLDAGGLSAGQGAEIVRLVPRDFSGSARLGRVLTKLARTLPAEASMTEELARACSEISSSRVHADTLLSVADARGVPAAAAREFARSASRIESSSEKARAIEGLALRCTEPVSFGELADAAGTIESSAERRRALVSLAARPGIDAKSFSRILLAGEGIASSAEKASFLESAATRNLAGEPLKDYLAVAGSIESSAERRRALTAILRPDVSREAWIGAVGGARKIASSAEKSNLLESAAASSVKLDSSMVAAYLDCASTIESSSEKRRAAVALLRRGDLESSAKSAVTEFAEHEIESRSERLAVLHQVGER
jgi:hypothetical protein